MCHNLVECSNVYSHEQLHQPPGNTSLNDLVNALIVTIGQVGEGPASIGEHLIISVMEQARESWQSVPGLRWVCTAWCRYARFSSWQCV